MIQFGISGWRAVIGEDFTKANLHRIASAPARRMIREGCDDTGICAGNERRFLRREACIRFCGVMAWKGNRRPLSSRNGYMDVRFGKVPMAEDDESLTYAPIQKRILVRRDLPGFGLPMEKACRMDGCKVSFPKRRILFSGTEPRSDFSRRRTPAHGIWPALSIFPSTCNTGRRSAA